VSRFVMPNPLVAPPGIDLIAMGADLAPGTLLAAYRAGLFPMPDDPSSRDGKIAWYSPDPRGVIPLDGLRVSRSLRKALARFEVRHDTAFREVMVRCADERRPGRWITSEFVDAYCELYRLGWAHSVEIYRAGQLVGGLYGVRIGGFFAGESMFHVETDASKVALVHLVDRLSAFDARLLDVQWATPHLESLGAIPIPRPTYLGMLADAIEDRRPGRK